MIGLEYPPSIRKYFLLGNSITPSWCPRSMGNSTAGSDHYCLFFPLRDSLFLLLGLCLMVAVMACIGDAVRPAVLSAAGGRRGPGTIVEPFEDFVQVDDARRTEHAMGATSPTRNSLRFGLAPDKR